MSWPLASFLLVAAVLIAGWLSYERARPSARMVAVVGTLAAVAALGRDAFVALPDVKPITAMTLVVGYSLGPLPGFAVGAVGMLASNILLGQGPYTPWQMAAWGLVGLAGAALGRLSGRRLGRVGLALACAVAAVGAKEIMNVYTWTLGAAHTPAAFLAVAGSALPFDITDVVASLLFGLAFAPELARVLERMRARMDVSWEAAATPLVVIVLVLCAAAGTISAASTARAAVASHRSPSTLPTLPAGPSALGVSPAKASAAGVYVGREVSYLESAQNSDGGFGAARGQSSSELYSAWTAIALAAAGRNPLSVRRDGHSVLDALRAEASTLTGAGDWERTILALHACGVSVYSLAGRSPVAEMLRARAGDGSFSELANLTAFAIFALRAAGHSSSDPAVRSAGRWLERQQNSDGGFGFATRGGASDVDDTAAVLQGLIDASVRGGVLSRAVAFIVRSQNLDGGFPQQRGGESNAQSTAWAVQGLVAAGRNVSLLKRSGSRSPLGYLDSLLTSSGSINYSRTSGQTPVWVTAQAIPALTEVPLPVGR